MDRSHTLITRSFLVASLASFHVAFAAPPTEKLEGTWALVAADVKHPDGTQTRDYGSAPEGILMVDKKLRYSIQIFKAERSPFTANDKSKSSDEEYKSAVMGSSIHYGTLKVDPSAHTVVFTITDSSYPNWKGQSQTRKYTLDNGELSYFGIPRKNGDIPITVWKREP
jgi:hypothetical protein